MKYDYEIIDHYPSEIRTIVGHMSGKGWKLHTALQIERRPYVSLIFEREHDESRPAEDAPALKKESPFRHMRQW